MAKIEEAGKRRSLLFHLSIVSGILLILALFTVLFLPSLLLKLWANRSFDEPDALFIKLEAREARVSPFLNGFTLKGVKAHTAASGDNPAAIAEIRAEKLQRLPFLKLLCGLAGPDVSGILQDGSLVILDLRQNEAFLGNLSGVALKRLELQGVDVPKGEESSFGDLRAALVELESFAASPGPDASISVPFLSLKGLKDGYLESLSLRGVSLEYGGFISTEIGELSLDRSDLRLPAENSGEEGAALALIGSFFKNTKNLDLKNFQLKIMGSDILRLFELDYENDLSQTPARASLKIPAGEIGAAALFMAGEAGPEAEKFFGALEFPLAFALEHAYFRSDAAENLSLSFQSPENLSLRLIQDFAPDPGWTEGGPFPGSLLEKASLGTGTLDFEDSGFLPRLNALLAEECRESGSPCSAAEALEAFLRSRDPSGILDLEAFLRDLKTPGKTPSHASLRWEPAPGFPRLALEQADNDPDYPISGESLLNRRVYAIFDQLNLKMSVDGGPDAALKLYPF
ncbi:MAG: hypothetical protein LBR53_13255 [Deltaproteobacteria bacterium]|jgi:hypothetical protein|nr:hypothetical protein [Deltaproteobacteria bacterium]